MQLYSFVSSFLFKYFTFIRIRKDCEFQATSKTCLWNSFPWCTGPLGPSAAACFFESVEAWFNPPHAQQPTMTRLWRKTVELTYKSIFSAFTSEKAGLPISSQDRRSASCSGWCALTRMRIDVFKHFRKYRWKNIDQNEPCAEGNVILIQWTSAVIKHASMNERWRINQTL